MDYENTKYIHILILQNQENQKTIQSKTKWIPKQFYYRKCQWDKDYFQKI